MEIFFLVGHANTGKSSIIRALTGISSKSKTWEVEYTSGVVSTYIHPNGLQEQPISIDGFLSEVSTQQPTIQKVIAALRFDPRNSGGKIYPSAQTYLDEIERRHPGWIVGVADVTSATVVNPRLNVKSTIVQTTISGRPTTPSNSGASVLRNVWGIS